MSDLGPTGSPPDTTTAIVDPAGLSFIQNGPGGAGGASGAIYEWLGIKWDPSFPYEVRTSVTSVGKAKAHTYPGKATVIHVVGPNFMQAQPATELEAVKL